MNLISVVLSGGAGTRLWPESRKAMPKPFMNVGGSTLLAQTFRRGLACGAAHTVIVTNQDYLFLTADVARDVASAMAMPDGSSGSTSHPPKFDYVLEPAGRNTAPAIAIAALQCAEQFGEDAVMLVLAADHLIPDTEAFVACVKQAAVAASAGKLVVFGVVPTSPETGFGYIEVSKPSADVQGVLRFVEKPNAATAMQYLQTGRYYWNSGMFCFTAKTILTALAQHAPAVMNAAQTAWAARQVSPGRLGTGSTTRFEESSFSALPDISIDYAVMEPAAQVAGAVTVVPSSFFWSDVGSWPAIADAHEADDQGNTFLHDVVASHTSGTHVQVQSHGPKVVATIGVENLIIVDTPDALLVAHKSAAQHIKHVVDTLKTRAVDTAAHQTTQLPATVHRPWGTYASLKEEAGYKVKRITVKPGESLSLQYHHQRAEHWVVVQGTALIQVGDEEFATLPGQYRYIPLQAKHRLTNTGTNELVLIEVQCGNYLGEDDIVRLADTYGRA